jgi:hypothetical protein
MKTLVSSYQEIKEKLKSQLEDVETTEQIVKILQDEISKLVDFNGDYILSLTPQQARLATVMLNDLNQYTSILGLAKLQDSTPNASEKSNSNGLSELTTTPFLPSLGEGEKEGEKIASLILHRFGNNISPLTNNLQTLTRQIQIRRDVISSLLAGGLAGTLAGGYSWGFVGAILGGAIAKIVQPKKLPENTDIPSLPESRQKEIRIGIDIDKLLDHLYQSFQSIDMTVAAYGAREEKGLKPGLENDLDLLEYLQDLMADALDEQTQLPIAVRRRIEQAATILRHYGIQARVYQSTEEQDLGMFYFEPSLDPNITDYITLKHAFVKDDQVLLPGYVIIPHSN